MKTQRAFPLFALVALLGGCGGVEGSDERLGRARAAIFGGSVDQGDPAVVALTDDQGYYFCSGTLVDATHVVTAAHCLNEGAPPSYVFTCTDSNQDPYSQAECYLEVSGSAYHPSYDGNSSAHDIGVVTLSEPAAIAPIPVAANPLPESAIGTPARIVGFGDDEFGGTGVKRQAQHSIDEMDANTFIMWGLPNHCYGDSGGPAFWPAGGPNEGLVGVTSAGTEDQCDQGGGVDTRVSDNLDWLANQGVVGDPNVGPGAQPDPPDGGAGGGGTTSSSSSSSGGPDVGSGGDGPGGPPGTDGDDGSNADPGSSSEESADANAGGCRVGRGGGSGGAPAWTAIGLLALSLGMGRRRRRSGG